MPYQFLLAFTLFLIQCKIFHMSLICCLSCAEFSLDLTFISINDKCSIIYFPVKYTIYFYTKLCDQVHFLLAEANLEDAILSLIMISNNSHNSLYLKLVTHILLYIYLNVNLQHCHIYNNCPNQIKVD